MPSAGDSEGPEAQNVLSSFEGAASASSLDDLKAPLLEDVPAAKDEEKADSLGKDHICDEEQALLDTGYAGEIKRVLRLSIPLSITNVLAYGSSIISLAFVGHLGAQAQATAVLGTSFGNVTGFSILLGLSSAIDTLCGQAYGAKNYRLVGIILQRALLLQVVFFGCMWILWAKMGDILLRIGQEPILASSAAHFIHLNSVSLLFGGFNACLNKYLQAQGIVVPSMVALVMSTLLSPLFNWLLIYHLGIGISGAPITNGIVNFSSTCLLIGICIWHNRRVRGTEKQTWHGWQLREAVQGWGMYLKLAIPALIMQCLEWWLYEALIVIAGLLPNAEVGVSVIGVGFNCSSLIFCVSLGLSGAASTRISNSLGAGFARVAKRACILIFLMEVAAMAGIALAVWLARAVWVRIFTVDPQVIALLQAVMPIIAWSLMGDGVNCVVAGTLRGTGRQAVGAATNIFTYWIIGLPVILLLVYKAHLGVLGIWLGLALTTSFQGAVMLTIISRFKWRDLAEHAALMVGRRRAAGEVIVVVSGH